MTRYTIKYGCDHEQHRYTHDTVLGFSEALASAAQLRRSYAGQEDNPNIRDGILVWVEDESGQVMAGEPALRPGEEMVTLRLPPKFWEDHASRDLPEAGRARVVRETKTGVYVELDPAALADLRSDAALYADPDTASEMGLPGLASSARSTLAAIAKQTEVAA